MKNTPKNGSYKWLVFYHKKEAIWYGVALEFNIVVSGDSYIDAFLELKEAVTGYIIAANKIKGLKDHSFLNQEPDPQYLKLWNDSQAQKQIPSPYAELTSGVTNGYATKI